MKNYVIPVHVTTGDYGTALEIKDEVCNSLQDAIDAGAIPRDTTWRVSGPDLHLGDVFGDYIKPGFKVGERVRAAAKIEGGLPAMWTGEVLSITYHEAGPVDAPWLYHVAGAPAYAPGSLAPVLVPQWGLSEDDPNSLSRAQAIALYKSNWWVGLPDRDVAMFQFFEPKLCMPFNEYHRAMEKTLGRPVFTHEFSRPDLLKAELMGDREAPTFQEIMEIIPEGKRLVIIGGPA